MRIFGVLWLGVFLLACSSSDRRDNKTVAISDSTKNSQLDPITFSSPFSGDADILFDGKTLEGWKITEFGTEGPVHVTDGSIMLGFGDGCTGVTLERDFPVMDYEVYVEAMKVSGNDFFCGMTFPVNDTHCSLIVGGWGGPVVGLSTIDGLDASDNQTKILKNFERNIWYRIRLKVSQEKIEAWIDEEKVVDFVTTGHKLSIRPEVNLSRPFGIASWNTTAALRNIMVQKTGE